MSRFFFERHRPRFLITHREIFDRIAGDGVPPAVSAFGLALGARILGQIAVAPFDRWRVLLQTAPPGSPSRTNLFLSGFRGISPSIGNTIIYSAVFTYLIPVMKNFEVTQSMGGLYSAHVLTALAATGLAYPLEVRYVRRAAASSSSSALKIGGMLRGMQLAIISVPISVVASLSSLQFLSLVFPIAEPGDTASDVDFARGVGVGCVSALVGATMTYPIDTVRRRMILGETFQESVKMRNLFRGAGLLVMKSFPQCALVTYSYMCNLRYFSFASSN